MDYYNYRLLIISNNVLSRTNNNGKTIYSYIKSLDCQNVRQLYFSGEIPMIEGYEYYRLYDKDVIRERFSKIKKGSRILADPNVEDKWYREAKHTYGDIQRLARELLWYNAWSSKELWNWIDEYRPTHIFFHAGDACFAYDICMAIVKKYHCKLSVYVTDDYVMKKRDEKIFSKFRRILIRNKLIKCLSMTQTFFTVSDIMSIDYYKEFKRKSIPIVNITESLKLDGVHQSDEKIKLIYAGSLYYGRDDLLKLLGESLCRYNKNNEKKAILTIYSNTDVKRTSLAAVNIPSVILGGNIGQEELKLKYNEADVIVFVESFQKRYVEKTKYSLSTKIPESLSLERPILAIGPKDIGSMDVLRDVAYCINDEKEIDESLATFLGNERLQRELAEKSRMLYLEKYDELKSRKLFLNSVFNGNIDKEICG